MTEPINFDGGPHPALLIFADSLTLGNIVRINLQDGTVTRLADYTNDEEAGRLFWQAVEDWKKLIPT